MIISASRRTDIPSYFSEWFINRIKEGYVLVRNPMNIHQVSKISLSPDVVDCIVFWTKNPKPMLERLDELKDYPFYFQFTLTSYGRDVEKNIPSKNDEIIETFKRLAEKIGDERVIWRYDPILLNSNYTVEYHINYFGKLCDKLQNHTNKCVISFIDFYKNIKNHISDLELQELDRCRIKELAKSFSDIAHMRNIILETCSEKIDLSDFNINPSHCIDAELISSIAGCRINVEKDKNQRIECGCVSSVDIGSYNTCSNGCKYCYANHNENSLKVNMERYDKLSPLLCSNLCIEDKVSERKIKSFKNNQISLF